MAVYKCRKCGSILTLRSNGTAVCEKCGTRYALPKTGAASSAAASRANTAANARRNNNRKRKKTKKGNSNFFVILLICLALLVAIMFIAKLVDSSKDKEDDDDAAETTLALGNESGDNTSGSDTNGDDTDKTPGSDTNGDGTTEPPESETQQPVDYPIPDFKADLSAYEMYMNPTGDQRDAYLILVNVDNPLPADYKAADMIAVKSTRKDGRQTQYLREYAAKALEALMLEAEACGMIRTNTPSGFPLSVMSAYRSYEYQGTLFNQYVNSEMANRGISRDAAEKIVEKYSNRPGTSEHQAGLCVDMHTHPSANQGFKNEQEAKWLAENCYKFGFILRYPEDKMEQTKGIMYEPWHFRYVGRYHATRMHELNMCLEEYVVYLENNA